MDLSSLESWASFFRRAIVLFGLGSSAAAACAFYSGKQNETKKQSGYQFAGIILGLFVVGAAALNFDFTDRVARAKDEVFQRFRLKKDTEIKNLEHGNLVLRKEIGDLEKNNLTVRSKVAKLEAKAEQQRERRQKLEKELLEAQERIRARVLTSVQRTGLLEKLSIADKGEIDIDYMAADAESEQFARDISRVLKEAGWTVTRVGPRIPQGTSTPFGLRLIVRDPQQPNTVALLSAFEHVGIAVSIDEKPRANPPVQLWVGTKPR